MWRRRGQSNPVWPAAGWRAVAFDFIVIDERHRGGANDEGNWRAILDYFATARRRTATSNWLGDRAAREFMVAS